jgi:hypothetical protein
MVQIYFNPKYLNNILLVIFSNYFKYLNLSGMDREEPTEAKYIFPGLRSVWKKTGYTVVRKPRTSTAAEMVSFNNVKKIK